MKKNAIDLFGEKVIRDVRDRTIRTWIKMISGGMKGETAKKVNEITQVLNVEQLDVIKNLLPIIIDECIYNFLYMVEENDEIILNIDSDNDIIDIKENSDGLSGELFEEEGWIMKYSQIDNK